MPFDGAGSGAMSDQMTNDADAHALIEEISRLRGQVLTANLGGQS